MMNRSFVSVRQASKCDERCEGRLASYALAYVGLRYEQDGNNGTRSTKSHYDRAVSEWNFLLVPTGT